MNNIVNTLPHDDEEYFLRDRTQYGFFITSNEAVDLLLEKEGVHVFAVYSLFMRIYNATKEDSIFPSQATIVRRTKISSGYVAYVIRRLAQLNVVVHTNRRTAHGDLTSNVYYINDPREWRTELFGLKPLKEPFTDKEIEGVTQQVSNGYSTGEQRVTQQVSSNNTKIEEDTINNSISDKSENKINTANNRGDNLAPLESNLEKIESYSDSSSNDPSQTHDVKKPRGRPKKNGTTPIISSSNQDVVLGPKGKKPLNARFELYRAYCEARGEDAEADDSGKGMKLRQFTDDVVRTMTPADIKALYEYVYTKWARASGGTPTMKPTMTHLKRDYNEWRARTKNLAPTMPSLETHDVGSSLTDFQKERTIRAKCAIFKPLLDSQLRDLSDLQEIGVSEEEFQWYLANVAS